MAPYSEHGIFKSDPRYAPQSPSAPVVAAPSTPKAPTAPPISPAMSELNSRSSYIRGMLGNYEKTALGDNARTTAREVSRVSPSRGGIYSSASVSGALRNRAQQSGDRSRGYLENMIAKTKSQSNMDLSGDIAGQLDHEENRRQGYAFQSAQGNAQRKSQNQAETMQLAGMLGAAALIAFV